MREIHPIDDSDYHEVQPKKANTTSKPIPRVEQIEEWVFAELFGSDDELTSVTERVEQVKEWGFADLFSSANEPTSAIERVEQVEEWGFADLFGNGDEPTSVIEKLLGFWYEEEDRSRMEVANHGLVSFHREELATGEGDLQSCKPNGYEKYRGRIGNRPLLEGISPDRRSAFSTSSKYLSTSRRVIKGLNDYTRKLVDIESFTQNLEDWILESCFNSAEKNSIFRSPFPIDELRRLDYALEGVFFQHLFRMPYSLYASDNLKEDEYLALEDFLQAIVYGLWRTFWHKSGPLPFFVSCPRRPGFKFCTVEKAITSRRLGKLCGAALVSKTVSDAQVQWDQVVEYALFKQDILQGNEIGFSAATICEALFYGFHMLLARRLSKPNNANSDSVYLLVLDSKFGGVIKFGGDLSKLEATSNNPYHSVVEWIKLHAEISISPIDRIWNKLGNANWGDVGTLQLILATFYSIVTCKGPPRKSIAALAADHSLRLQKRKIECNSFTENGNNSVLVSQSSQIGEIVELEQEDDLPFRKQTSHLTLKQGEVLYLEDPQERKGFHIQDILAEGNHLSYNAVSLEHPSELLTVHVGAHPSRLEPSWEDMSLWYQVQRQTKVLNIMKQQGISSQYLPEIVASGRVLHSGPCRKKSARGRCDHHWCGTPVLVTRPVGEPLSSVVAENCPFSSEDALHCCRDCLSALRSASTANIFHGDICPENIVRVVNTHGSRTSFLYIPVSWGRAVLEDRDSPTLNLQFSSTHALQQGKLCPSSDAESLIYLLYFISGGPMQQLDSIESALRWREKSWARRSIQKHLGEVSSLLKALADYVDSLCGTPYSVDYDIWLKRLNREVDGSMDRGKLIEAAVTLRLEDVAESSGTSGGGTSFSC
ncbi:hypothetical protein GIB67_026260 [Kingdonia uniflora]|uniref:Uncharacterized protein n=1 Tax=Kingdonia uniflora TaxID=39325 RepID=A0A7J7LA38_9MAGN|nr:hypothetical protein GIB67_026260 [Kingdonia uniflora]